MNKTLIVGYPYVRESYFATFRHYPQKDVLIFLLPEFWKAKGGRVIFNPPEDKNIIKARVFFFHSKYPVIGGLFKGFMPIFPWVLFKHQEVDLVFSCSEPVLLTTLYYAFFAKLFRKKHIFFTWENIPYWEKSKGIKWFFRRVIIKLNLFFSDGVICGNKKGRGIFKKLTKKPIAIIPMNGVDDDFFRPQKGLKKEFRGINLTNKIVFTFAGAIGYRKGIHLILEAYKGFLKELPNSFLIIAGSGEYEKEIDSLIENLGLENYVLETHWLNRLELKELLSVSDIFLYPSLPFKGWEEQFGYSMAEASLMEIPIISTRTGSVEEVVIDNVTGILVRPDNIIELTRAMTKLAKDENLRKKMGRAGREYIVKNFNHKIVAQKFGQFFHKINARS